jgi:hypothetical protein
MPKSLSPNKIMLLLELKPRIAGGQEMTYGRSLEYYLKHFGQARADGSAQDFAEGANIAQDRVGWHKLVVVHGAARLRRSAAPRHLRRRRRHIGALSPSPQQQPNHKLLPPR